MNFTTSTDEKPHFSLTLALALFYDADDLKADTKKRGQWLYPARLKKSAMPAPRPMVECPDCEGAGVIAEMRRDSYLGMKEHFHPCETCGETGRVSS